jgi:DNA-binding response OmpR family regulator
MGFDDVLAKPYTARALLDMVDKHLPDAVMAPSNPVT